MAHLNGNNKSILEPIFKMDFLKKFKELLIDATIGLVKQYQDKTLRLVKIEALSVYIRSIQLLRRQVLIFTVILFLISVTAAAIVIVPFVLLALAPWSRQVKLVLALLIGTGDICVPLFMLKHWLSEEKWMEFTKSNELMDSIMKNG